MLTRVIKDPLLHFLLIGLCLFFAFDYMTKNDEGIELNRIVVDRERLLTFMQNRAKIFEADRFGELLDQLSEQELQELIVDYVQEEALYREAKALNLDRDDYIARRRLIQQLEFITRGFISAGTGLSEEDLQAWYKTRKDEYAVPPRITFTHVFLNSAKHGKEKTKALALAKLSELNDKRVPFHAAMSHGDRFLYHTNYVEKGKDEITSHFGQTMSKQLFALAPDEHLWLGPFQSAYGFHLVMVTMQAAGYVPTLAEIRQKVERDALQELVDTEVDEAIQSIIADYKVDIASGIQLPAEYAGAE